MGEEFELAGVVIGVGACGGVELGFVGEGADVAGEEDGGYGDGGFALPACEGTESELEVAVEVAEDGDSGEGYG